MIGTVILLGFLLLMIAFRSLLIPLQAAVTNLLSAAAAFGVLTAAFQWGWGISLVGIDTPDDIGADRQLRAADDVRGAVRAVDGLRGLPGQPHPACTTTRGEPATAGRRARASARAPGSRPRRR